jgi:hypothetical protein
VAGSPVTTFISPIDLSAGPISCHYTTKEQWIEQFGHWAVRAAWYYVRLLGRLVAP